MENSTVVVTIAAVLQEIRCSSWCFVIEQFQSDIAEISVQSNRHAFASLEIVYWILADETMTQKPQVKYLLKPNWK